MNMKPLIPFLAVFVFCLLLGSSSQGQNANYTFKVAMERRLWHDNIDKQQKKLLSADGQVHISSDQSVNLQIANAMIDKVDQLQQQIELDSTLNNQDKIKYLRNLDYVLQGYNTNLNKAGYPATIAPELIKAFKKCVDLDRNHESIESVIKSSSYGVGQLLVEGMRYSQDNPGIDGSKQALLNKYCRLHPDEILTELRRELAKNPGITYADSLIVVAAHRDIRKFYDYAQARNPLGDRIRNHPDPFVQVISKMANSRSGQLYYPFLDNLVNGKTTFAQIDEVKDNPVAYYRLMVNTRIDYAHRLLSKDTALEMKALTERMARTGKEYFIREINGLHTVEDDNVRFKRLEGLNAQELYYLAVLSEDEIYTSSYTRGVYPRIIKQLGPNPHGDSLLMSVYGDYFRKFIKIAAGYNTLNGFLGTMNKENAATLMQSFVIGLEKTTGLEDAVDVADSYSSIMDKNKELASYILDEVVWSYTKNKRDNNKRGIVIYDLLKILFESADSTRKTDLSAVLGIPSIYGQSYESLKDDSGRVIQQVFFYGDEDKDGQNSFVNFMSMFRNKGEWVVDNKNPNWVTIKSVKGKPIWIFANRPLYGDDDPDEKAQLKLIDYLFDNKLKPTVVVHRGHSYHLSSTLAKLPASAKIVVLGSCGGYNNLNEVLTICEDAHIISSKQVGTKTVNEPILQAINANLLTGTDIDWIAMWRELSVRFRNDASAREKFEDYIPPYKNLGAIFIKAYRKRMEKE